MICVYMRYICARLFPTCLTHSIKSFRLPGCSIWQQVPMMLKNAPLRDNVQHNTFVWQGFLKFQRCVFLQVYKFVGKNTRRCQECYNLQDDIHPGLLTWNLKITQLKRKIIFQTSIFGFHVNLPGYIYTYPWSIWTPTYSEHTNEVPTHLSKVSLILCSGWPCQGWISQPFDVELYSASPGGVSTGAPPKWENLQVLNWTRCFF